MRTAPSAARWLLFSDLHFRHQDLDRISQTAQWIASLPQKHNIQRVVVCGDVLTSRTMQPTHVLSACYRFLGQLSDAAPRVDIVLGNHDLAYKNDYSTTALDALSLRRLAPYVSLHTAIGRHEWDGRNVLVMPFRENQRELTEAVASLNPDEASRTVGLAHLAIHKAITQRHVVKAHAGQAVGCPVTYRGMIGPDHFAPLARTFTGHFHSPQTILQPRFADDPSRRLQGSLTYLGSPLQLTWADLHDEQRGVMLLDPDTLEHEFLVNPHAVGYMTVDVGELLGGKCDLETVEGKYVMLLGELTRSKYVTARDKLLSYGARGVRDWSPLRPSLQSEFHGLGATVPSGEVDTSTFSYERSNGQPPGGESDLAIEARNEAMMALSPGLKQGENDLSEPMPNLEPLDLVKLVPEYVDALDLDPSLDRRREELTRIGQRLIRIAVQVTDDEEINYRSILDGAPSTGRIVGDASNTTISGSTTNAFIAQPRILTISNFLGIQGTITLDFAKDFQKGLTFIVGHNGSGKSTLIEAMVWCQFGRCLRTGIAVNQVINDQVNKDCSVSLDFGNGYNITRYRKHREFDNRVIVSLHGVLQTEFEKAEQRHTQALIDELLGIDYDAYVRTVVLGHGSAVGFLNSTPIERREIIESLLGLSILDRYGDVSSLAVRQIEKDAAEFKAQIYGLDRTVSHIQARIQDLKWARSRFLAEADSAARSLEMAESDQTRRKGADQANMSSCERELERMAVMDPSHQRIERDVAMLEQQNREVQHQVSELTALSRKAEMRTALHREDALVNERVNSAKQRQAYLRKCLAFFEDEELVAGTNIWPVRTVKGTLAWLRNIKRWCIQWVPDKIYVRPNGSGDLFEKFQRWIKTSSARMCLSYLESAERKVSSLERDLVEDSTSTIKKSPGFQSVAGEFQSKIDNCELILDQLGEKALLISRTVAQTLSAHEAEVREAKESMTVETASKIPDQFTRAIRQQAQLQMRREKLIQESRTIERRREEKHAQILRRQRCLQETMRRGDEGWTTRRERLRSTLTEKQQQAAAHAQLLAQEEGSLEDLHKRHGELGREADELSDTQEMFALWASALSRRRTSTPTLRSLVLEKRLHELNALAVHVLRFLFEDAPSLSTGVDGAKSASLGSVLYADEENDIAVAAEEEANQEKKEEEEEEEEEQQQQQQPEEQTPPPPPKKPKKSKPKKPPTATTTTPSTPTTLTLLDSNLAIAPSLTYGKRSGGERKRIDLALFFALLRLSHAASPHRARYLLVDEVFDSLDAAGCEGVVRWCDALTSGGLDFVAVVTHSEHLLRMGGGGDGGEEGGFARWRRPGVVRARMGKAGMEFEVEGEEGRGSVRRNGGNESGEMAVPVYE